MKDEQKRGNPPRGGVMSESERDREAIEAEQTDSSFILHPSSFPTAWEEVAAGRYMPRRIKGSCKGRALG
jgi:hypothetical protein